MSYIPTRLDWLVDCSITSISPFSTFLAPFDTNIFYIPPFMRRHHTVFSKCDTFLNSTYTQMISKNSKDQAWNLCVCDEGFWKNDGFFFFFLDMVYALEDK